MYFYVMSSSGGKARVVLWCKSSVVVQEFEAEGESKVILELPRWHLRDFLSGNSPQALFANDVGVLHKSMFHNVNFRDETITLEVNFERTLTFTTHVFCICIDTFLCALNCPF